MLWLNTVESVSTMTEDPQFISYRFASNSELEQTANLFLLDCEARNLSAASLRYYWQRLRLLLTFLETQHVTTPGAITPALLRAYFLTFKGKSPHYLHGAARVAKTFLNFLVREGLLEDSPMRRVKMPTLPKDVLPPFTTDEVQRILEACPTERDRALVLTLLDSGVRARELLALNVADVDMTSGAVTIRRGKGGKDRTTYVGASSRLALGKYLLTRGIIATDAPLFVTLTTGTRLTFYGLQSLLRRLGAAAGVADMGAHRFRRTFAIESLRAGMGLMQLAAMMGHGSLPVLQRYLRFIGDDLQQAHQQHGAVAHLLRKGRAR